jgi:hypothetical protein
MGMVTKQAEALRAPNQVILTYARQFPDALIPIEWPTDLGSDRLAEAPA